MNTISNEPLVRGFFGNLRGDLSGGLSAAIVALPIAIGCGVVAFSPLGRENAGFAAQAGIYSAIFVTLVAALFGGSRLQVSGPKSSLAVILAATLAGLLNDPLMPEDVVSRTNMAIVLVFLCVVLAGLMQIGFGLIRLGSIIKFIPFPVTAGFINGLAFLIIVSQLPLFFSFKGPDLLSIFAEGALLKPKVVLITGITILAMWLSRFWLRKGGDAIIALLIGTGAYFLAVRWLGSADMGGTIGLIPPAIPYPHQMFNFWILRNDPNIDLLLLKIVPSAFVLAILASIESLLSAVSMDARADSLHRANRELMGQGLANVVSGGFGGLSGGGSPSRSVANYDAGGRTRLASIIIALVFVLVLTFAGPVVANIPFAVTAGILIVYAFRMIDGWTRQLISKLGRATDGKDRRDVVLNLMIVVLVAVLTVATNLMLAVGVGFAVASFLFIIRSGQSPVYRQYTGSQVHSKNARPLEVMQMLKEKGGSIFIIEARGPIFFGSAEKLASDIDAIREQASVLILDLRRVTEIDATGANILRRVQKQFQRRDKKLLISHLSLEHPLWEFLEDMEVITKFTKPMIFTDSDRALTWAEDDLLASQSVDKNFGTEIALTDLEVLVGLEDAQIEILSTMLIRQHFSKNQCIFEEGSDGRSMYFLAAGSVSVVGSLMESDRNIRFAGIGPGVVFGEMAILGGMRRTAAIYADEDVVCYSLTKENFQRLGFEHPDITIRLLLNIGMQAAHRLEMTSAQVRALEN